VYAILNSMVNVLFTVVLAIAGVVLGDSSATMAAATRRPWPSGTPMPSPLADAAPGSAGLPHHLSEFDGGTTSGAAAVARLLAAASPLPASATPFPHPFAPLATVEPSPHPVVAPLDKAAFHGVFAIFVALTFVGSLATGLLYWDSRRRGVSGPLKKKHAH
jgi:hypothetical protein